MANLITDAVAVHAPNMETEEDEAESVAAQDDSNL